MQIKVTRYKENPKQGNVKGFVDIEIMIDGTPLSINGVTEVGSNNGTFYGLPQRSYTNNEGETKYVAICGFFEKETRQVFNDGMKEALEVYRQNTSVRAKPAPEPDRSEDLPF